MSILSVKQKRKDSRVEHQIALAVEARYLQKRASDAIESIPMVQVIEAVPQRKGTTRAYEMGLTENRIKFLWDKHRTHKKHGPVIRSAMDTWREMEAVIWALAMTSKRVAHLEARRLTRQAIDEEDLRQDGYIGLVRAAQRFDCSQGVKFDTYARWWARAEMTRAMEQRGRTIRIPAGAVEQLRLIHRVKSDWEKEGLEYSLSDIAAVLNLETKRVHRLLSVGQAVSLETEVDVGQKTRTLGDLLKEEVTPNPEVAVAFRDQLRRLTLVLHNVLSEREREVLTRRYGINDHTFRTLKEMGLEMGISQERVRQIEILAFDKIRRNALFREKDRSWNVGRAA